MKLRLLNLTIATSLVCTGCVAGPGGSNNAANRTIVGVAVGSLLGGLTGGLTGSGAITGVAVGALAGGALGAAVNPEHVFRQDTRGYCYRVDEHGIPIYDEQGQLIYDYSRRC